MWVMTSTLALGFAPDRSISPARDERIILETRGSVVPPGLGVFFGGLDPALKCWAIFTGTLHHYGAPGGGKSPLAQTSWSLEYLFANRCRAQRGRCGITLGKTRFSHAADPVW